VAEGRDEVLGGLVGAVGGSEVIVFAVGGERDFDFGVLPGDDEVGGVFRSVGFGDFEEELLGVTADLAHGASHDMGFHPLPILPVELKGYVSASSFPPSTNLLCSSRFHRPGFFPDESAPE
jgi:hypothetical protein